MKFTALASGSSGNCFAIEKNNKIVLIDAGITCKQTLLRLENLKLNPKNIDSIFITHEHHDHIRGLNVLKNKTNADIFMTKKTFLNSTLDIDDKNINFIKNNETIKRAGFEINAFSKNHDSADPVSFLINGSNSLAVLTDIGVPCNNVIDAVKEADSVILESNHDEYVLQKGNYPEVLKKRILSEKGHLSNKQASLLVLEHAKQKLNNLVLAHLSINNNTETLAYNNMASILKHKKLFKPRVFISNRQRETSLLRV